MAAHRQTARSLDEEKGDIAVRPRRRIEDHARHHVMAARFEHEPRSDPVEAIEKMRSFLAHRGAHQGWCAAGHQPYRIAARVTIDTEERLDRHRLKPLSAIGRKINSSGPPGSQVGRQSYRDRGLS